MPQSLLERLAGHPKRMLTAVNDVSFTIASGKTFSLVGESGCGKSTLARTVAGLYRPDKGTIRVFGIDSQTADKVQKAILRRRMNMIFQDPYASLNPRRTIFDAVSEPLRVQHPQMSEKDIRERVIKAVELVRLTRDVLEKYPHQFSGGQRQRICIARALTGQPDFLICDEPTSALDVSVQAQVLNLMRELQEQIGITYLLISHNLAVVHHMSDNVGVMYLGRLVETATKEDLFDEPLHPYTRMLIAAIPTVKGEENASDSRVAGEVPSPINPPSGCPFHPRCPMACEKCRHEVPVTRVLDGKHGPRTVACHQVLL
ncbi:MAG TPA: ABC transporter ATP-binding protein [Sutterella sp.]|nr:ABC transporter ATP-binding protein [Sutterella sp.]